jgi:uncharacterized protein (DUF1697 family)
MTRYVALLRGINVTGYKVIKMEELRKYFEILDFKNIVSYIQSGNVLFDSAEQNAITLKNALEHTLQEKLGYTVTVILRTVTQVQDILLHNPFSNLADDDERKLSITFLNNVPAPDKVEAVPKKTEAGDECLIVGANAYILYRRYSDSIYTNTFLEKKLGVAGTTRNLNTVQKIAKL